MSTSSLLNDVMLTDIITVDLKDDLRTIRNYFEQTTVDYLPVVENSYLRGMINRSDFAELSGSLASKSLQSGGATLEKNQVKVVMNKNFIKLATRNTVEEAVEIFEMDLFHTIPIVNEQDQLVGIITESNLINHKSDTEMPSQESWFSTE